MDTILIIHDAVLNFLINGLLGLSWWQVLLATLAMTHVTIAAVTIFLHRAQAHHALVLHAIPSHFFRSWLWLTTGMLTRVWVAIHRKHHAKCETADDPHSPQTRGIEAVLLTGSELYRVEANNTETLRVYGEGTPDDWIERHLYTKHSVLGVSLMMIIDLLLFGALGVTVWAVQMLWIPITAAGMVNGIGHWWGYRNFEAPDQSRNFSPWGIIIGGEELHNNHHTYPTSAKLSVKPFEFDIGWAYIRAMEMMGLAHVRKTPPKLSLGEVRSVPDGKTLEALIANRYEFMARYAQALRNTVKEELLKLRHRGEKKGERWKQMKLAQLWLSRDSGFVPKNVEPELSVVLRESPNLATFVAMREELRMFWTRTNVSAEQLVSDLGAWCRNAEASGITALREFSRKLRAART